MAAPIRFSVITARARDIARVDKKIVTQVASFNTPTLDSQEARCVLAAVSDYSLDRPRRRVRKVSSGPMAGYSNIWSLSALVNGWVDGDYTVYRIQKDLEAEEEQFYEDNDWRETVVAAENAEETVFALRFLGGVAPTAPWALWWLEPHVLAVDSSTIPVSDEEAVAQRAAYHILTQAATRAAVFTEGSPLRGDSVQYRSISTAFKDLAKACDDAYKELIAKRPAAWQPTLVDTDHESPRGPYTTHLRRNY